MTAEPIHRAITDFDYEGGRWNGEERQFMGFAKVTATLPAIDGNGRPPKVVSTYHQDKACLGKTSLVESLE